MSVSILDNLRPAIKEEGDSIERDNAPIPVELWLYWLNDGLQLELNLSQWQNYVVVLQEEFLVLR